MESVLATIRHLDACILQARRDRTELAEEFEQMRVARDAARLRLERLEHARESLVELFPDRAAAAGIQPLPPDPEYVPL